MSKTLKLFIEQVLFDFVGEVDLGPKDKPKKSKSGKDILVEPSDESRDAEENAQNEFSVSGGVAGYTLPLGAGNRPVKGPGPSDHLGGSKRRSKGSK